MGSSSSSSSSTSSSSSSKSSPSSNQTKTSKTTTNTQTRTNGLLRTNISPNIDETKIDPTIKDKLDKVKAANPNFEQELQAMLDLNVNQLAYVLGDKEAFKNTFLKPNYNANLLIDWLQKECSDLDKLGKLENEKEIKDAVDRLNAKKSKISQSNLYFLLTDCMANNSILRFMARNTIFDFGSLHTALSVDCMIIEWGRGFCGNSLVCPSIDPKGLLFQVAIENPRLRDRLTAAFRNHTALTIGLIAAASAGLVVLTGGLGLIFLGGAVTAVSVALLLQVYLESLWFAGKLIDEQFDKLAEICVLYNKHKHYGPVSTNCQKFVNDCLEKIGLKLKFEGELKKRVDEIIEKGCCDFRFYDELFTTRAQLDSFAKNKFASLDNDDKKLILAYKNIFDSYISADPDSEKYQTSEEAEKMWHAYLEKRIADEKSFHI